MRIASRLVLLGLLVTVSCTGLSEVEMGLPVRPKLPLVGHEKLYIGPFLRESRGDEAGPQLNFDVTVEFERYLRRLLRKETKLILIPEIPDLRPPTTDTLRLAESTEFWRNLGTTTGADYIVAGSIDFQIQDRTGYETEEYVSPVDGRTYYRQILVEQTGFTYDILIQVYDARSGRLVLEEPLKDFQERPERSFDEFVGMFSNLYALENQLVGLFVPRTIKTKRFLFSP